MIVDLPLHATRAGVIAHRGPQLDHFAAGQLQLFELEGQPRGAVDDAALLHGNDQRAGGQNDRIVAELIVHRHDQVDLHLPGNITVDGLEQLPVERLAAVNGPQRLRRDGPAGRLNEPLCPAPRGGDPLLRRDQPHGLRGGAPRAAVVAGGLGVRLGQHLPPFLGGGAVALRMPRARLPLDPARGGRRLGGDGERVERLQPALRVGAGAGAGLGAAGRRVAGDDRGLRGRRTAPILLRPAS